MNSTEMLRTYAAANGIITLKEARAHLGMSVDQSRYAADTLLSQGYLRRVGHGTYRAAEAVEKPGAEIEDRILRAMRVSASFSANEIAMLAGSTTAYVYKRFRGYRADGIIKEAGMRSTHGSGTEKLWRLTLAGKERTLSPHVEEFRPDPLILATVNLNRLICSGLAVREDEAARQALALIDEIRARIMDGMNVSGQDEKGPADAGTSCQAKG